MTDAAHYWPFYCEENVWLACAQAPAGAAVVLVSNARRAVALCFQRAAGDGIGPVVWDYHVILVVPEPASAGGGWTVLDADSTLGARVPASLYLERTFAAIEALPDQLRPRFRVLDASEYRTLLSSDRAHMRRADGSWSAEPPPWPAIEHGPANLMRLIDLDDAFAGELLDLDAVRARFG